MLDFSSLMSPLFVPADRPDRYAKAFAAGADAVIIDLEDAVAPDRKAEARDALSAARGMIAQVPCPVMVRINAHGQSHHEVDCRVVADLPLAAVILPKAESAAIVSGLAAATSHPVVALIESVWGLAAARAIAEASARLAFGSIDFAVDLDCAHEREALLAARSELVIASRLAGLAGPIDGITTRVQDPDLVRADAAYAAALGFAGKLLIHPAQIAPAREGFRPNADDIAWAERALASGEGAVALEGAMVDAPVRMRAENIRRRAAATAS